jgi:hypothetical protein
MEEELFERLIDLKSEVCSLESLLIEDQEYFDVLKQTKKVQLALIRFIKTLQKKVG